MCIASTSCVLFPCVPGIQPGVLSEVGSGRHYGAGGPARSDRGVRYAPWEAGTRECDL